MIHILILLSLLILSSPLFGQSERPETIIIPVSSLGDVSEVRKQILQNTLEDELKTHFRLIPQQRFEEVQEKVFEELEYEECTEDQCIMMIQEMLQVENVFHLQVIGEGSDTQLSLSWRNLDEKKKETDYCEVCKTKELNDKIRGLVGKLVGVQGVVKEVPIKKVETIEVKTEVVKEAKNSKLYLTYINDERTWVFEKDEYSIGEYNGGIRNNLPHGIGELTYDDGIVFKGQWVDGYIDGQGEMVNLDGSKVKGIWKKGRLVQGKYPVIEVETKDKKLYLSYINDERTWVFEKDKHAIGEYRGKTINNIPNGEGFFQYYDGDIYSGQWENGYISGNGIMVNKKNISLGLFNKIFSQGLQLDLEKNNITGKNISGIGLIRDKKGSGFRGQIKKGKPNGLGLMEYKNGEKYFGNWTNGIFDGQGIYISMNHFFIGVWENNKKWNVISYDKNGNILGRYVNGVKQK